MKKLIMVVVVVIVLAILGTLLFLLKSERTASVVRPSQLPPNGVHVSAYPVEGDDNIVRVEIIANIPELAAGFDISVGFDSNSVAPINNAENTPATVGDLFTDATLVRNVVVSEQDSHIRLMYVFFGEGIGATGQGTLATIDFEILPDARVASITMLEAKLARINEQGIAEYIPLVIGEPLISLIQDNEGNIVIDAGTLPGGASNILLYVAIAMVVLSLLGLVFIVIAIQRMRKQNPTMALQS